MAKEDIYFYCETQPEYHPEWHWITEGIALGSYPLDAALNDLLEQGVTAICSLRMDEPDYDLDLFEAAHVASVEDGCPFPYEQLTNALRFLHAHLRAGRKVYVHCFAGVSRSAFVVSCYLMLTEGISFDEAVARVRAIRPIVFPNAMLYNPATLARLLRDRDHILTTETQEAS